MQSASPCGLCLLQRGCLALLTGVCLMASVQGPGRFGTVLYWLFGAFQPGRNGHRVAAGVAAKRSGKSIVDLRA
jgi:disulfide bond formation protein DsbB